MIKVKNPLIKNLQEPTLEGPPGKALILDPLVPQHLDSRLLMYGKKIINNFVIYL